MDQGKKIRSLLAEKAEIANRDVVEALDVSSATSHRLLQGLVLAGMLERRGQGRATTYGLRRIRRRKRLAGLNEDALWQEVADEITRIRPLDAEAGQSLRYAATEVINNAVDHSGGKHVEVSVDFNGEATTGVRVVDDGVGVFRRVCDDFGYASPQAAIVQLEKGKLTSDPARHSGEGLFFSSKAVSRFRLESNGVMWLVDNTVADSGVGKSEVRRGTRVTLTVEKGAMPTLREIFAAYTDADTMRFTKTRTTVKLSSFGSSLISRSEAKRVAERLTEFESAVLDFSGIEIVGQGFCDELFRVFASRHPDVNLEPVGMNEMVEFMVARAKAASADRKTGER